ncbi:MAG: hypothetical protein MZV64_14710 [Ignavibacteriales bacterium]|nr:hypothetical protein [Ignavibacteriales bacterium]
MRGLLQLQHGASASSGAATPSAAQATGNPTGLVFPNNASAAGGGIGGGPPPAPPPAPNYAVNLPAAVGDGSGGAIGLILGSAAGAFNLNLRLSALENRGVVKTISRAEGRHRSTTGRPPSGRASPSPSRRCSASGVQHHLHRGEARAEGDAPRLGRRLDPPQDQGDQQRSPTPSSPAPTASPPISEARGRDRGAGEGRRDHRHRRHLHPRHLASRGGGRRSSARSPSSAASSEPDRAGRPHRDADLHHAAHPEPGRDRRRDRRQLGEGT